MVFFSCNACGQSVKKNQVEKHYQLQCRNCEILSCVDCGKEFKGDDYKGHTKCISEEEKYGGRDFRQTQSANKGEVKQDKWIENIQNTIASAKVRRPVFSILESLLTFSNIPRKKVKFEKFLHNSLKIYDARLKSEIWDVVNVVNSDSSGKDNAYTSIGLQEADRKDVPSKELGIDHVVINREQSESEQQVTSVKKKKKKHKQKKLAYDEENVEESNGPVGREGSHEEHTSSEVKHKDNDDEICSEVKKKKKHKRKKGAETAEENPVGEIYVNETNANSSEKRKYNGKEDTCSVAKKKKKHKQKKRPSDEENGIHIDENNQSSLEDKPVQGTGKGCKLNSENHDELDCEQFSSVICSPAKKKKHKQKNVLLEEEKPNEEIDMRVLLHEDSVTKKQKKNHVQDNHAELQSNGRPTGSSKKKKRKSKP